MIILNECTDCGRFPEIYEFECFGTNFYTVCMCGKSVKSNNDRIWIREVAADMWNLENPVEQELDAKGVYLNFLAGELNRFRLRVMVTDNGLTIHETCQNDKETGDEIERLLKQCRLHTQDLAAFYKKRLEPAI